MLLNSLPVAVVNPTRVRALSKATGKLAKTDVIDPRLIAEYAFKIQPAALEAKEANEIRLKALVTRREQLVEMRTAELNRLGTAQNNMQGDIRSISSGSVCASSNSKRRSMSWLTLCLNGEHKPSDWTASQVWV